MKKTLIYFAAAAGTILAASSCCGEMSYKEYGFTENAALKDGLDAALDISIMMEYPDGGLADETISKICNAITVTAFGEEYAGMSPQDAVNACAEKYIASYREINLELAGSEAGAGASALSWDKYTEGMFTGTYGKKMTGYKVTDYSYTGGAHGMSSETCLVFNMKTGDRVSLDDIFRDDSRDILTSLLTRHAKDGKTGNDTAVKDGSDTVYTVKALVDGEYTDSLVLDGTVSAGDTVVKGLYTGDGAALNNGKLPYGLVDDGTLPAGAYYTDPAALTKVSNGNVTGWIAGHGSVDGSTNVASAVGTLTLTDDTKVIIITGDTADKVLTGTADDLNYDANATANNSVIVMTRASTNSSDVGYYQAGIVYIIR